MKHRFSDLWNKIPSVFKWPLAALRQLPVALAVAKLPLPYNFSIPCICAGWKTIKCRKEGYGPRFLIKYYFKTLSRTFFGLSLRKFIEQGAKYTLSAELGISEDAVQAIGIFMIIVCVILDALD